MLRLFFPLPLLYLIVMFVSACQVGAIIAKSMFNTCTVYICFLSCDLQQQPHPWDSRLLLKRCTRKLTRTKHYFQRKRSKYSHYLFREFIILFLCTFQCGYPQRYFSHCLSPTCTTKETEKRGRAMALSLTTPLRLLTCHIMSQGARRKGDYFPLSDIRRHSRN